MAKHPPKGPIDEEPIETDPSEWDEEPPTDVGAVFGVVSTSTNAGRFKTPVPTQDGVAVFDSEDRENSIRVDSHDLKKQRRRFETDAVLDPIKGGIQASQRPALSPVTVHPDDRERTTNIPELPPPPVVPSHVRAAASPINSAPRTVTTRSRSKIAGVLRGTALLGTTIAALLAALNTNVQKPEAPDLSTSDVSDDLGRDAEPDCVGPNANPETLFAQVENQVLSDEAVSTFSEKEITRLTAHATNALVSDHFVGAHSWKDLKGEWRNNALPLVVAKLETWGGYEAVLDSIAASPTPLSTIDGALEWIAADKNLNSPSDPYNSDQTALALAKQIALIKDKRIAADPEVPQGHLDEMGESEVELAVSEAIVTPPPAPAPFKYPTQLTAEASAALYDAPEPMNLQNAPKVVANTPVLAKPPVALELTMDPTDAPDPHFLKPSVAAQADFATDEKAFFTEGEAISAANAKAAAALAPQTFTQKAKETVKGWASKVSRWFS